MQFKAFIFDLDGTLLNSLLDISDSVNIVLEKYKLPLHDIESYKYFVGNGIAVLAKRALPPDFSEEQFPQFLSLVEKEYAKRQMDRTKPYEGILEMLRAMNEKGISISVLSNKPDEFTKIVVNHYFKDIKFDIVLGATAKLPRKPDPAAVYYIVNKIKIPLEDIAFVGDTSTDIQTGKNSGIFSIGVSWGFRKIEELNSAGADLLIHNPDELFNLLPN